MVWFSDFSDHPIHRYRPVKMTMSSKKVLFLTRFRVVAFLAANLQGRRATFLRSAGEKAEKWISRPSPLFNFFSAGEKRVREKAEFCLDFEFS